MDITPDPENPPIPEEAVPLNQIHGSNDTIPQTNVLPASTNFSTETVPSPLTVDQSDRLITKSEIPSLNENSLLLPNVTSVSSLRRASSLEGLDFQKNQEKQERTDFGKWYLIYKAWQFKSQVLNILICCETALKQRYLN